MLCTCIIQWKHTCIRRDFVSTLHSCCHDDRIGCCSASFYMLNNVQLYMVQIDIMKTRFFGSVYFKFVMHVVCSNKVLAAYENEKSLVMSIILMKFNFADLVTARLVREGRHLSCWGSGCLELLVNINHPCMFCGWWLGNVVCLSASCCWFNFPTWKEGEDLVLGRPPQKASCEAVCVLSCVVLNRINLRLEMCMFLLSIYMSQ